MEPESTPMAASDRIHGLDAYRGVLMVLGILIHVALGFIPEAVWDDGTPSASSLVLMGLVGGIHTFRMPAFFVLSGFFGALLWEKRGAQGMLINRFNRLVLPFSAFVILLNPAITFCGTFRRLVEQGAESPWTEALKHIAETSVIPESTFHLWFLYDLIYIVVFSSAAVWVMKRIGLSLPWLVRVVRKTIEKPWRSLIIFGSLHAGWYLTFGWESLPTDTSWRPNPSLLAYYLSFYAVGWMCFKGRAQLSTLQDRARTLVAIGVGCVVLQVVIHIHLAGLQPEGGPPAPIEGGPIFLLRVSIASIALVALSRGFAGLFMRYAGAASTRWRFISDSAYWVYLVHLPIAFLVPALLIGWDWPVLIEFLLSVLIVSAFCWLSYDALVRGSAIGRLLNGRTYAPAAWKASTISLLALIAVMGLGIWTPANAEPMSLWRDGRSPRELLPGEEIGDPFEGQPPAIPRLNLASCIEVRGYAICPRKATYIQAIAACSVLGGTLATIETQDEATQVATLVRALTDESMYIGLSDEGTEGAWVWLDSTPLTYDPWGGGQPDNHGIGENCVDIMWNGGEGWNDVPCSYRSAFICELDGVD